MAKVLKVVGTIAGIAGAIALAIPSGGTSLAAAAGLFGMTVGGTLAAVGLAAGLGASLLTKRPKGAQPSSADRERLNASINPRAPRTIVYGRTAMATDIRDQEFTGTDKEYLHRFIVVASHKVEAIESIYFDDKLAWTVGDGVQGEFVGYLTVTPILEGSAANAINISPRMGSSRRFTGCAYLHLRYKLTGNTKKTDSPFAQSIPTRITIEGKGMACYDPRLDSTVAGGSGPQRADDQSTWVWNDSACRNPALQLLNYLLGWRINGLLAVGKGIPSNRIDISSFITAANACDEPVTLAAGGTEPRYRTDGVFNEFDDMTLVLDQFKQSMNAVLDDADGLIRITVLYNDLGSPVTSFTADDIIGEVDWNPAVALDESINVIRGTFTDPSPNSLYQSVSYPEVDLPSIDGIERSANIDYPLVQSGRQVQRLAKQRLQRAQYPATLACTMQFTAWRVQKNDIITLTFPPLGFVEKLFRVIETGVRIDGTVPMLLREENAAIYAWDADESPVVLATAPTTYNFLDNPLYQDIAQVSDDVVTAQTTAENALSAAALRGRVFFQDAAPSLAESSVNDTWVTSGGIFYERAPGLILLDSGGADHIITLNAFRPAIYWFRSHIQPLEDVIDAASKGQIIANAALDQANAAAARLVAIDDDDVLDIFEKTTIFIPGDTDLESAYQSISTAAATAGIDVSTATLTAERSAYLAFRNAIAPAWNDKNVDSPVIRTTLDTVVNAYRAELNAVSAAISTKLQLNAGQAATTASSAIDKLDDLANDGIVSRDEKVKILLPENARLEGAWSALSAAAAVAGVSTTTASAARASWLAVRDALAPDWNDIDSDSDVDRAAYDAALIGYDNALEALNTAIIEAMTAAKQITISKPADQVINRTYNLQVKPSQLPRTITGSVKRGNVDIIAADDVSHSVSGTGGLSGKVAVNNIAGNANKGKITIDDTVTNGGEIHWTIGANGITFPAQIIKVTTQDDDAPSGGGAGSTASTSALSTVTGTSYQVIAGPLTVNVTDGAADVSLSADYGISETASAGTYGITVAIQWNNGGGWETISGTEATEGSPCIHSGAGNYPEWGYIDTGGTKTGLATGNQEFRAIAKASGSNTGQTLSLNGMFVVEG